MITRRRFVESGVASLAALAGLAPFIERLSAAESLRSRPHRRRMAQAPDVRSVRRPATGSHGTSVQQPVESREADAARSRVPAAGSRCSPRRRSSTAGPAGPASGRRSTTPSARKTTRRSEWFGRRSTAADAAAIRVTCSTTGRSRPDFATASTVSR